MEELVHIRTRAAREEAEALRAFIKAEVARAVREAMREVAPVATGEADRLMTVREAAHLLNVEERTVYDWVNKKKIPYRRAGGSLRFMRSELLAWTAGTSGAIETSAAKQGGKLHALR